ncbi:tRNA 5-methoxyuridine(34)/uridine 5-oxyacetic acid(34) synthase CmoB [Marinospirillum sp.]|uniref:tRNA 5-methoxyuridine(34)/uridine 5-oxyacetic acid(34) synthase CmoB n=1 Tax=Marinospirillum sp. TaxID=2183934 RepID=UPI003A899F1E
MASPDFSHLYTTLAQQGQARPGLHRWLARLPEQLSRALSPQRHPEFHGWWQRIEQLPQLSAAEYDLNQDALYAGEGQTAAGPLSDAEKKRITGLLDNLHPWRKGPFLLHDTKIDTEWRSDWKWQRVAPHLSDLRGRLILDVGGGSGYHAWRMAGAGAALTLCIDPSPRYFAQFEAVKKLLGPQLCEQVYHLPLGIEDVPEQLEAFDSVFSMGVLYHRRSPIDHLLELKACLRSGGELVLETLVVEGDAQQVLLPQDRYAAMRNVWFLPSVAALTLWLERAGFADVRCVDLNRTTTEEQRSTDWMRFQSLADFLDPEDPSRTREGYPAPLRAVMIARKP